MISQLDLIVSVDTAVAHVAGAMDKPVWLLLQHNADFAGCAVMPTLLGIIQCHYFVSNRWVTGLRHFIIEGTFASVAELAVKFPFSDQSWKLLVRSSRERAVLVSYIEEKICSQVLLEPELEASLLSEYKPSSWNESKPDILYAATRLEKLKRLSCFLAESRNFILKLVLCVRI